jgi:hypothetical protein
MAATFCIAASFHTEHAPGRKLLGKLMAAVPPGFKACYIGAPIDDNPGWASLVVDYFKKVHGVACAAPRLSDPACDVAAAKKAIETADVLYLDGGDTVACVEYCRERGVLGSFKKAAKHAKVVFGLSGGACATGPFTIGYDDDGNGSVAECLDMGPPHPLDVHDEQNDWPEMRALLELVAGDKKREAAGIVIPTGAALMVSPEGKLSSYGKARVEIRRLGKGGRWEIEKLEESDL